MSLPQPPEPFSLPVITCPACNHGIDPHGTDPGDICGVGDEHGVRCRCFWSPNDIAAVLISQRAARGDAEWNATCGRTWEAGVWWGGRQALRDAAAAAEGMHDPPAPDCKEWASWLLARAERATVHAVPHGGDRVEAACVVMHDAYEKAAVGTGWETNPASRKPWADVPEANKATMRAAVAALLDHLREPITHPYRTFLTVPCCERPASQHPAPAAGAIKAPGADTAGKPAAQPAAGVNAPSEAMDGHDGHTTRPSRTSAGSGTTQTPAGGVNAVLDVTPAMDGQDDPGGASDATGPSPSSAAGGTTPCDWCDEHTPGAPCLCPGPCTAPWCDAEVSDA